VSVPWVPSRRAVLALCLPLPWSSEAAPGVVGLAVTDRAETWGTNHLTYVVWSAYTRRPR